MKKVIISAAFAVALLFAATSVSAQCPEKKGDKKECCKEKGDKECKKESKKEACKKKCSTEKGDKPAKEKK